MILLWMSFGSLHILSNHKSNTSCRLCDRCKSNSFFQFSVLLHKTITSISFSEFRDSRIYFSKKKLINAADERQENYNEAPEKWFFFRTMRWSSCDLIQIQINYYNCKEELLCLKNYELKNVLFHAGTKKKLPSCSALRIWCIQLHISDL